MFPVCEEIQSFLRDNNFPEMSMYEQMLHSKGVPFGRVQQSEDEGSSSEGEEEGGDVYSRYRGLDSKPLCPEAERLTEEQFKKWKALFDKELATHIGMLSEEEMYGGAGGVRLTGRQEFEQRHGVHAPGAAEGGAGVVVDEDLFKDMDYDDDDYEGEGEDLDSDE